MTARAYYNEFDPKAAAWLRELIKLGAIPDGDVDERSICDVRADDLSGYVQCHFFAGVAGWPYALRLAGWPDDRPVWTGSCPCQAFSVAGKGEGTGDHRDLWPVFASLIRERKPCVVFGEQVAAAIGYGWLDRLRTDLEAEGYAIGGHVLGAHSAGAPHGRQRLYWVAESEHGGGARRDAIGPGSGDAAAGVWAYAKPGRCGNAGGVVFSDSQRGCGGPAGRENAGDAGQSSQAHFWSRAIPIPCRDGKYRLAEPGIFPLVAGLSRGVVPSGDPGLPEYANATAEGRVMRLKGYGNAIVPQVAAMFARAYMDVAQEEK